MIYANKKITFLISSLAGGGAEGVCVNIANGLAENGWEVTLVVLHMNNSVYHEILSDKVNLIILHIHHARHSFKALYKYIKRNDVRKLVVFNYELTAILNLIRISTPLKFYLITRNINSITEVVKHGERNFFSKIRTWITLKLYKKSDHIINQCEGMREDFLSVFPNLVDKTSVIYNPVNKKIEKFAKEIDFLQIKKQDYLLCVGRLEKQKSFHYAIEAFALFVNANIENQVRLKIIGQGSLEHSLKKLAIDLGVDKRVDFEGFQKDITPYYLNAKATLLTSLYEGFPNALIESITLGTPVIAFDCPSGPREIIKEGVNGYLALHLELNDLVRCIDLLYKEKLYEECLNITESSKQYFNESILEKYTDILS